MGSWTRRLSHRCRLFLLTRVAPPTARNERAPAAAPGALSLGQAGRLLRAPKAMALRPSHASGWRLGAPLVTILRRVAARWTHSRSALRACQVGRSSASFPGYFTPVWLNQAN